MQAQDSIEYTYNKLFLRSCDFGMLQRMMTEDAKVDENVAEAYKYAFRNPGTTEILHKLLIKYGRVCKLLYHFRIGNGCN